jgi:hypothetical protein
MRKNIFTTLLFICLFAVNLPAQTNFKTGDQAEVSWNGVWYKAQVLEVKDGKYKINYLGYGDSWDEWVDNSRIRRTGQQATAAQTASNNSGAFKPGDLVEIFAAGEAKHGIVVGGYQQTDFGYATYKVHEEGAQHCNNHRLDSDIDSKFVQKRFQPNASALFAVGEAVEVRSWNGSVYKGQVLSRNGNRYEVSYTREGMPSKEFFDNTNMRSLGKASTPVNPLPEQRFKAGDQVEVSQSNTWHKAEVLEARNEQYRIRYSNGSPEEWVDNARIRSRKESTDVKPTGSLKVGDLVELLMGNEAKHGVIVGGLQKTDFGYSTYQVHLEGEKFCSNHQLDTKYDSRFVQKRFQPNTFASFVYGEGVEVRAVNGTVYKGHVLGRDENSYEVSYNWQGTPSKEWFYNTNIRSAGSALPNLWPERRFKLGDRVMYNGLGFLVNKSFGTVISIDPVKRMYTLRDETGASSRESLPCYNVVAPNERPGSEFFVGKWDIFIPPATYTFIKGDYRYRNFSAGMKLPPLEIKADGTYEWTNTDNKVVRGVWVQRKDQPGITLLKALDGKDYTLYEKTEANATSKNTKDEIGLSHLPSSTGFLATRVGANKSCTLLNRKL